MADPQQEAAEPEAAEQSQDSKVTFRALLVGTLFAAAFAVITVYCENRRAIYLTATQIAVLPYVLLFATVLLLNPICRILGRVVKAIKPFGMAEILIVFIMGSVSGGISTFGLASQLIPVMHAPFNEHWNNEQSQWDVYVEPFVNEAFFISEPGIREAASRHRAVLIQVEDARRLYDAAESYVRTQGAVTAARETREEIAARPESAERALALGPAQAAEENAQKAFAEAEVLWREAAATSEGVTATTALESYPAKIAALESELAVERTALDALEEKAFAKVSQFRRGLADHERAFPGILWVTGDNMETYQQRLRHLRRGGDARGELDAALDSLEGGSGDADARLAKAEEILRTMAMRDDIITRKQGVDAEWDAENKQVQAVEAALEDLQGRQRLGEKDLEEKIDAETEKLAARNEAKDLLTQRQERLKTQLDLADRVLAAADALASTRASLKSGDLAAPAAAEKLAAVRADFRAFDASLQRYLVGDVPWSVWARPIFSWGLLIILTYIVLMTFNVLIFRQWAHNEKLIYPLAQLPEILAGNDTEEGGEALEPSWLGRQLSRLGAALGIKLPPVFRSGFFWFGFAIAGSFLGYNMVSAWGIIPNLTPLDFQNKWWEYISGTAFEGLRDYAGKSTIFFTMIGLAFLIPANISFSLWFFILIYMVQVLCLVWLGHGHREKDFRQEWYYTLNFMTAQGGGALMVFAAVVMYKCRKYILCCIKPEAVAELDAAERRELRIASALFILGSVGLIAGLWLYMGANLWYTIFAYCVIMMITIGLIRAVAEGGILGFQAWVSPFHFIRTVFGMDKTWTSPSLFAPLFIYYSIIFLDIKTFIAPAMANSIKIRDDLKMKRGVFHVSIILAIGVAITASVVAHLIMGYDKGGDAMNGWFYSGFPRGLFNQIATMTKTMPVDNANGMHWLITGALAMALLLWGRQFIFWLPHPIGLIMLVNPIMRTYWFSIMLGWLAKSLVTKYGNTATYRRARNFFVGLIVGELFIIVCSLIVTVLTDKSIGIDLNRN
jgi:hypothetical protein